MSNPVPPACVTCAREFVCYKNDVFSETSTGYFLGDVFQCPSCGFQVLIHRHPAVKFMVGQDLPEHAVSVMVTRESKPGDHVVTSRQMLAAARRVFPEAYAAQPGPTHNKSGRMIRYFKIVDADAHELALAHVDQDGRVILHPIK
jgi:DNA-directed RNA polymerase subunit RPC12/RpoP